MFDDFIELDTLLRVDNQHPPNNLYYHALDLPMHSVLNPACFSSI